MASCARIWCVTPVKIVTSSNVAVPADVAEAALRALREEA